jgi:hypothetical protein
MAVGRQRSATTIFVLVTPPDQKANLTQITNELRMAFDC